MPRSRPGSQATMDAELTSRALERAALRLLARDGVLAGLNLREVAEEAGVNRGLVYHYFGSRRDLLRAALRRDFGERMASLRFPEEPTGLGDRIRHSLRAALRYTSSLRLAALLVLDGAPLRLMPEREQTQARLADDRAAGRLSPGTDLVAVHAAMHSTVLGYTVTRDRLAEEFGLPVAELDERFGRLVGELFATLDRDAGEPADQAPESGAAAEPTTGSRRAETPVSGEGQGAAGHF